jgi:hypothetical protein
MSGLSCEGDPPLLGSSGDGRAAIQLSPIEVPDTGSLAAPLRGTLWARICDIVPVGEGHRGGQVEGHERSRESNM